MPSPEILLQRGLHRAGMRFRLHVSSLLGHPDLVFPKHRAVILVHGCFWHGHGCPMFRLPATRTDLSAKIAGNRERDRAALEALLSDGWRVLTVWECSLKGPSRLPFQDVLCGCVAFIRSKVLKVEILAP
ncbi:MAG: very short patch repair endonuclease [Rhodomicrobium sp.]